MNHKIIAVAGAGKTTAALNIALENPDHKVHLFTYNTKLSAETCARFAKMPDATDNFTASTFHSFINKYFMPCRDTCELVLFATRKPDPKTDLPKIDILILDECQDMTPEIYFAVKYIYALLRKPELIVMGDPMQTIYQFQDADSRFLTEAEKVFAWNKYPWKTTHLKKTYRVTEPVVKFIKESFEHAEPIKIRSKKEGPKPRFIFMRPDGWITEKSGHRIIVNSAALFCKDLLERYKPGEIMILSHSMKAVKGRDLSYLGYVANMYYNNALVIGNYLMSEGVPVHITAANDDTSVLQDKVLVTTFHQAKGIERPCVVLANIGPTLDNIYASNVLTNALYVAMTRASKELVMFSVNPLGKQAITSACIEDLSNCRVSFFYKTDKHNDEYYIKSLREFTYHRNIIEERKTQQEVNAYDMFIKLNMFERTMFVEEILPEKPCNTATPVDTVERNGLKYSVNQITPLVIAQRGKSLESATRAAVRLYADHVDQPFLIEILGSEPWLVADQYKYFQKHMHGDIHVVLHGPEQFVYSYIDKPHLFSFESHINDREIMRLGAVAAMHGDYIGYITNVYTRQRLYVEWKDIKDLYESLGKSIKRSESIFK